VLVNPDCFPWADSELLRRILYCDLYVELKVPRDDEKPRIQFKPCPITIQHMVHEIRARVFPNVGRMCVLLTSAADQNAQACPSTQDARALRYAQLDIMDHFPTNWGRPVSVKPPIPRFMLKPRMFS